MKLTRVSGIAFLLGLPLVAACSDAPTATPGAHDTHPRFENGGSYGSGGKAQSDSTAPASADAPMDGANGGSYGSGG